MASLCEHDLSSLAAELTRLGAPASHARRVLRAFYGCNGQLSPGEGAVDIPSVGKTVVRWLQDQQPMLASMVRRKTVAADGTTKLLIGLADGAAVETVLMPTHRPDRTMACVSSQVGCAMGCDFCASTKGGLERNLTAGEIAEQFVHLSRASRRRGVRRITSLVFMGMGEPMHNLDAVLGGVRRIADPDLGGLGWRQVTISTVGIVPGIDPLGRGRFERQPRVVAARPRRRDAGASWCR